MMTTPLAPSQRMKVRITQGHRKMLVGLSLIHI